MDRALKKIRGNIRKRAIQNFLIFLIIGVAAIYFLPRYWKLLLMLLGLVFLIQCLYYNGTFVAHKKILESTCFRLEVAPDLVVEAIEFKLHHEKGFSGWDKGKLESMLDGRRIVRRLNVGIK